MWNSVPVIVSSVFLAFVVTISGVQGQTPNLGTCTTGDPITGAIPNNAASDFYNSQTIYSILCEDRRQLGALPIFGVNQNFSVLCAALTNHPAITALLKDFSARITFFAPDNAALASVAGIAGALTTAQWSAILETHINYLPRLTSDLVCDACICTLEGTLASLLVGVIAPCRTRTITICGSAGETFQVGGANPVGVNRPQIGQPIGSTEVFYAGYSNVVPLVAGVTPWGTNNNLANAEGFFSDNAVACNGVIHAVNNVIFPDLIFGRNPAQCGGNDSKSDKGGKGSKGAYFGPGGGYGGYGGFYGGKGGKRRGRRELGMEEKVFEDEDQVEDEVVGEGKDDEESSVPQQDDEQHSNTFEKRSQRRKRFLETLINPNGEIEQLE